LLAIHDICLHLAMPWREAIHLLFCQPHLT
jgi:hypothetical protein